MAKAERSKYQRTFDVKVKGDESPFIKIGSVLAAQVERFLEQQDKIVTTEGTPVQQRQKALERNALDFVTDALNNGPSDEEWNVEKVLSSFDKQQIDAINDEAMKRSGLTRPNALTTEDSY